MAYQKISVWQEHSFWLEVLEDHGYFVHDFASPSETQIIEQAKQYIFQFQQLRKKLASIPPYLSENSQQMIAFAREAYPVAYGYYQFEGHVQRLRIENKVNVNLTPSYFNGTLGENLEYIRLLGYYANGQVPPVPALVDLMDLWLEDQVGHAALLVRALDGVEAALVNETRTFMQLFQAYIIKNEAIKGYLRFTPEGFPIQLQFARDVSQSVNAFTQLVERVVRLYKNDQVLNQTTLRFLEHHFPEACYFLNKLTYYAPDIEFPPCSLSKPSFR